MLYWQKKVKQSVIEKKYIWDYQWWYAIWKNKGKAIVPNVNLILNLGFNNSGSHKFLYDSIRGPKLSNPINFPLIHPYKKSIDLEADKFTFTNAYSHSISRIYRLIWENGVFNILKYGLESIFGNKK